MKYTIPFIVFALTSSLAFSQSIQISETSSTRNNAPNQFTVAGHPVSLQNGALGHAGSSQSSALNSLTALSGVLNRSGISIYGGAGARLYSSDYTLIDDDKSAKVYVKPNGGFVVRENIANFLFYDALGNIEHSISNSTQSREGEAVSELAHDPAFKTVVLYNPLVVRNGVRGSEASVVKPNGTTDDIFHNKNRVINFLNVSDNGQFIAVVSAKAGTDDEVLVMDRFGNNFGSFTFNQNIADVRFTEDGEYVTIRSGSRVAVYSVLDGKRVGSTSFRAELHFADFIAEDNVILAVTGEKQADVLKDVELHAINIKARKIERKAYGKTLGMSGLLQVNAERTKANEYIIDGFSKSLIAKVRF